MAWIRLKAADHVLAFTFHHAIIDEWSMRRLFQELELLYAVHGQAERAGLPELRMQYADYAAWQRQQMSGPGRAGDVLYWQEQLGSLPPALQLPLDRRRPAKPSGGGAICKLLLAGSVPRGFRELARQENTSLYTVVFAAYFVWLHRLSSQTDILVGTPVANRERPEVQPLLGLFLNTLPIRARFGRNITFREFLRQTRDTILAAFDHASLPFEHIVELTARDRSASLPPLFETMFVLLENAVPPLHLGQAKGTMLPATTLTSKYELLLSVHAQETTWECEFEYSTDLLTNERMERLAKWFGQLLPAIVDQADAPISELNIMTPEERHQILVEWNRTGRDYPRNARIHDLFEEQCRISPDAVAVVFDTQQLTYQELNHQADRLAGHLRARGVGPGVRVGLRLERSLELVISLLGILKAGGAYWSIEEKLPEERLRLLLADASPRVLLARQSELAGLRTLLAQAPPGGFSEALEVAAVEAWLAADEASPMTPALVPCQATDAAYVSYTSGSTGRPKGVIIPHRGVVRLVRGVDYVSLTSLETILHHSPLAFDASTFELWGALLNGGRVVLMPPGTPTLAELGETIRRYQVTMLWLTSGLFNLMVEEHVGALASVRQLLAGGDVLSPVHVRKARRALPACRIINGYGPTENTTFTCCHTVGTECEESASIPIGRPIANTRVYVLDENRQPVPAGVAGELYAGGDGLACGYLNQPELTAERFIPDPFGGRPEDRLYRTGDLVRWRMDGTLEFLGRLDQQVKIRGFRIELGEIETAISAHPAIKACAVLAETNDQKPTSLKAFLLLREGEDGSLDGLRAWLATKLPDYMIPGRLVTVSALPLTPNGKLDRRALESIPGVELPTGAKLVVPRNECERVLTEIWQGLLHREQVSVLDNFFDLGGHSLLVAVMCARIAERLQREVHLRQVFAHPTIAGLASQLALPADATDTNRAVTRVDRGQPLPMSFGQQGMWLLQQSLPDPAMYHVTMACRITGPVNRERIRRALQVIQNRHEILRTALVLRGQDLVQEIVAEETAVVPWRELQLLSEPTGRTASTGQSWLRAQARLPFDLAQAPLWRADWLVLAEEEHVFALTFHHSIIDDWSRRLLLQELESLYATDAQVVVAGLPDLPVQYADYAVWQREELAGERLEKHQNYWRQELADLPPALELPADLPRPLLPSGKGAVYEFQIPESTTQSLRELARQERTTLFTVALAAFYVWLHRHTSQTDLVVGTPAAHRDRAELQSLLGYFLNTLPIRARLTGAENFRELVGQVRQKFAAALDHADLPFEQMVELAVKDRTAGQSPVYQVMFVLLEAGLPPLHLGEAQGEWLESDTHISKHDLILSILSDLGGWKCQLEYATDLFTSERVASMAGHLVELLAAIAARPQTPIGELNLLTAAERQQILVGWNRTSQEYPRNSCVHELFEEQCRITPEAVAVVLDQQTLTYQALNRQADRLAGHLRARGVGPGVRVGLRVERSLEMVVSLLGILKAGGAYWSVEENLPEERLRLLLADARPQVLLARQKELPALKMLLAGLPDGLIDETLELAAVEELLATDCAAPAGLEGLRCQATDPAYVSYTSGSTGRPKGVIIPHRGVVRLVRGADYVSLSSRETLLHHSPLSFDASTFEFWGALLNGGRVVLMPPGTPALAELGDAIRRHKVTTVWLTAGLFNLMVEEQLGALAPLRQLLAGGDVLSPTHVRNARRALPACRIINGYGPTENTTFTCCHTVGAECEESPSIPIGRPIANTRVYVLDARRQPVPVGVAGELYAGGDGVACGYLNLPELTAERFIPDPFGASPEDRLYRTGDQVRWRADGNLEFLGRADQQVKIRGFRVELGEIETALTSLPEVSNAIVVIREAGPGGKELVAYLVSKNGERPETVRVRGQLAEKLPDYMLPDQIVWLEQLPLTANGKVNRQALPAPAPEASRPTGAATLPLNLLELELIRIWQRIFQREDINRQDNFFDLGGHSLQAIRLAAAIDRLLGCQIPIAALFQCPTIETLARRLSDENWAPRWHSLVPLQTGGSKPPLFLIHGIAGDVYIFTELVKFLGEDQPVYGIQAVGLDGSCQRHTSIEQMAAHYVQEITSFQPEGPVYLAGYSLGGIIAWEIAQQLHRAGRRVALLGLLDSGPMGGAPWIFYVLALLYFVPDRLLFHFRNWWRLPWREKINYHHGRLVALRYWLQINQKQTAQVTEPPPAAIVVPAPPGFFDYYQAVAAAYLLKPYPGSMTLFYGDEALSGWNWYWRYLAKGGSAFYRVPGKHQEFLSAANVPTLARAFNEVLRQTQAAASAAPTPRPHVHSAT